MLDPVSRCEKKRDFEIMYISLDPFIHDKEGNHKRHSSSVVARAGIISLVS